MHMQASSPLFVDLDGTLIKTDLLVESFLSLLVEQPLAALRAPMWLARGKSALKHEIAGRIELDAAALPYNEDLLAWLRQQREGGRRIFLATASNERLAQRVADHLGVFDGVLASDEARNLSGVRKLEAIRGVAGDDFTYAGNDHVDVPIWQAARGSIAVGAPAGILRDLKSRGNLEAEFEGGSGGLKALVRALRPQQWLKNLLVFLPLLPLAKAAGVQMPHMLLQCLLAFVAFSLCASAVYVVNDLSDLPSDRAHPRKRKRPFASGAASAVHGILAVPLLLAVAFAIAASVSWLFTTVLFIYLVITTAYTFLLKRYALIDVLTLAGLYTIRVIGGAAAIAVVPSFWILAFSMFVFYSLALAKRYAELDTMRALNREGAKGRGYHVADISAVQLMGISSGLLSVLVMALYINSPEILTRYRHPQWLWGVCPLLMLWVSRVWLKAARSEMTDDPLVFAVKDKMSRLTIAAAGLLVLASLLW
ncbi:MAG: UbiA family prenyltransferase [Aquabacterium sp.]|nr:MAG: UbiA family prenyltransferase [Aquabacterium sp.]